MTKQMHYFSTIRGITEQETGKDTVYFGRVLRVPKSQIGGPEHTKLEQELLDWLEGMEPPQGVVERYEIFDSDDMVIMYRVPYQEEQSEEQPEPASELQTMDEIPEPPEELLKVLAGYSVLLETGGEKAAHNYSKKIAKLGRRLLKEYGIAESEMSSDQGGYLH